MFAVYDYSFLPIIHITMNNTIENDADFDSFTNEWLNIYSKQERFKLVFHTEKVGMINVKYALKMSLFMKHLRRQTEQYLDKSIIIVGDNRTKRLLNLIFFLQPPVADVYVTNNSELIEELLETDPQADSDNWDYVAPGKVYLPFL